MSSVKSCPLEESLCRPKSKKCCKVVSTVDCDPIDCCPTVPEVDPCACEVATDCCSLPYQRLDKLRSAYSTQLSTSVSSEEYNVTSQSATTATYNSLRQRDGSAVLLPTAARFTSSAANTAGIVSQGFFGAVPYVEGAEANNTTVPPLTVNNGRFDNAAIAYNFVQSMRYSMYRDVVCTSADQVIGFYLNPAETQLQVFQDLNNVMSALGLTYTDTLQYYSTLTSTGMTNAQKQKLVSLNILNELGLAAIRRVNLNPKTEGNIFEVTDRCCQKWLLVINTADVPASSSYTAGVNGYVVVACRV